MFDEVDVGIGGSTAAVVGKMLRRLGQNAQIFCITHLPQVAGKGDQHYKVYKEEINGKIKTQLRVLNADERIVEIAEMLGGKTLTDSALAHAKELLN